MNSSVESHSGNLPAIPDITTSVASGMPTIKYVMVIDNKPVRIFEYINYDLNYKQDYFMPIDWIIFGSIKTNYIHFSCRFYTTSSVKLR